MHPAAFWAMDASIGLAGALLLFGLKGPLTQVLEADPAKD
jgi:hypothetical protein